MARNRLKMTQNNSYVQPLKMGAGSSLVISSNKAYTSMLYRIGHTKPTYSASVWAKFDSANFDGIYIMAQLLRNGSETISAGSCIFKLYRIDDTQSWNETLVSTVAGTLELNGKLTAHVPESALGGFLLDGETTYSVEVEMIRFNKKYKSKVYVNHLGVYDSIVRLRQEDEFLFITKKDL